MQLNGCVSSPAHRRSAGRRSSLRLKGETPTLGGAYRGACVQSLVAAVERLDPLTVSGRVAAVNGLLIEARGGLSRLAVGARAEIERYGGRPLPAEVVGFR